MNATLVEDLTTQQRRAKAADEPVQQISADLAVARLSLRRVMRDTNTERPR